LKFSVLRLPCSGQTLNYETEVAPYLRHPVFAWLGLRPLLAQHTADEHAVLGRWAGGRRTLVEIGVAEGVSAMALREAMERDAILYLVDPFHMTRASALNFTKRAAHRAIGTSSHGQVEWIEKFSYEAAREWTKPLDFLMLDGDHTEAGVRRDWHDWSPHVRRDGVVVFHDARTFDGGWTNSEYGPVKLVDSLFRRTRIPNWKIVDEIHSMVVVQRSA
jgi:predicted O-methyltransferase YrrM